MIPLQRHRDVRFLPLLALVALLPMAGGAAEGFAVSDAPELAAGANLRVMSYNILSEEWNDKLPVDGRQESVSSTILFYAPDVVGLQEVSDNWYAVLPSLLAADYSMVCPETSRGQTNYTGMAYHKRKVTLLESGTDIFKAGNSTKLRLVTWGLYEKLDGGRRFLVMNTHWCIHPDNRMGESQEMADLFVAYREKYACPVITIGDYNSGQHSEEYQNYVQRTGLKNARVDAEKTERDYRTAHSVGKKPRAKPEDSIDQIFYTDDLSCLYYNVLIDPVILAASDHCPIYADMKLE